MPRYLLEVITFGGMLSIVLYLFSIDSDINQSLPIITLFTLAGYKLIPSLQQIYASLSSLKFSKSSIIKLSNELKKINSALTFDSNSSDAYIKKLVLNESISLQNVSYM